MVEEKKRGNKTTPGSFWNASNNRKRQAILFYLGKDHLRPKRFSEIYDNTKGICSSKHTLILYLRKLVKEGAIARKQVTRRNVEYYLKTSGYRVKKLTLECGQMPIKLAPGNEIRLAMVLIGEDRREYVPNDLLPFLFSKGWVFYDSKQPHFKYNYTREGIEFLRSRGIYVERWDWLSELGDLLS
ncbi:MAG: winged helix-turn-helix transcriptional regulator, partial [Nitrososphaerales archaeon]